MSKNSNPVLLFSKTYVLFTLVGKKVGTDCVREVTGTIRQQGILEN